MLSQLIKFVLFSLLSILFFNPLYAVCVDDDRLLQGQNTPIDGTCTPLPPPLVKQTCVSGQLKQGTEDECIAGSAIASFDAYIDDVVCPQGFARLQGTNSCTLDRETVSLQLETNSTVVDNATEGVVVANIILDDLGNGSAVTTIDLSGIGSENFQVDTTGIITVSAGASLGSVGDIFTLSAVATNSAGYSVRVDVNIEVVAFQAFDFSMTLDVNESTVLGDWESLSNAGSSRGVISASVDTQGTYGKCSIDDNNITYVKLIETNATDECLLRVSDTVGTIDIKVSIVSLFWKNISSGYSHTVAIKSDGTLWSWGSNFRRQLGDNNYNNSAIPIQEYTKATDWREVSAGDSHTIALKNDGTLWGWGSNYYGQIGDGTKQQKGIPTQESTQADNWIGVSAGYYHTVALKSDGTLWSWGRNDYGQIGDNSSDDKWVPTQESSSSTEWSEISAGGYHTVALKTDGILWSWGRNDYGQVGDNSSDDKWVPTAVDTLVTNWIAIDAGGYHTLALGSDRTLWGWGRNGSGQLALGTSVNQVLVPTQESTLAADWKSVDAGALFSSALKTNGTLWSWGESRSGQIGDSTTIERLVPTQEYTKDTNWEQISMGGSHSIAIKNDGTLWAWGYNYYGQLGDGTTNLRWTPVQESNGSLWSDVSAGENFTVAIKNDKTLWSWGTNDLGQLGNGIQINDASPIEVNSTINNWERLDTGNAHTVVLRTGGSLWAWGR